jgi:hypothetical protein
MQTIEFSANIENGIVHIPKNYQHLNNKKNVKLVMLFDDKRDYDTEKNIIANQVENYHNKCSNLVGGKSYKKEMQFFIDNLKTKYANS